MTRPLSMPDALAQAWDEGFDRGCHYGAADSHLADVETIPLPANPYRTPDEHAHEWRLDLHGLACHCGAHQGATPVDPERVKRNQL